jgi:hypothetical protein
LDKKLPLHSDSLSRVSKLLNVQTHERTRKDPTHCQTPSPTSTASLPPRHPIRSPRPSLPSTPPK